MTRVTTRTTLRRMLGPARPVVRALRERRTSALIVAVPQAEPVLARWRSEHGAAAGHGVPAHVTVLYPFLRASRIGPADHEALRLAAASVPAFDVTLGRVGRFPGVVYLAPDVTEPFAALLAAVQRTWPDLEPYGGQFETFVPHLTVHEGAGPEPPGLASELEESLPLRTRAEALTLIVEQPGGGWATAGRYPLG